MHSNTFLRRGFSPAPPHLPTTASVARRLPLSFRCNVSSVRLLVEKSNDNNYNKYGRYNKNNKSIIIQRDIVTGPFNSQDDSKSFPSPNARMALESLLCFSSHNAVEKHTIDIATNKKEAFKALLDERGDDAVKIMRKIYRKYEATSNQQIKFDAILAFIQILIHSGTEESLYEANDKLNEIKAMVNGPSDSRPSLYEAIIYTLLNDKNAKEIKESWRIYVAHIGNEPKKPSS